MLKERVAPVAKWLAGRVLRLIPDRIKSRLLPAPFRFDFAAKLPLPIAPDTAIRLLIAPVNYAGQAWQWSRAVTQYVPGASSVNLVVKARNGFDHPADVVVPLGVYAASTRWQRAIRDRVASDFTHIMIEAEKQPFGGILDESLDAQVKQLEKTAVQVLMLCHGSDIRLPSRHMVNNTDSPYADSLLGVSQHLERVALKNRATLDRLARPVFVSTPALLKDVPYAHWLPVVVDVELWRAEKRTSESIVPVVVHAPSSASVKGSEFIDPVLEVFHAEGLIEYRRAEGLPFERMPELYRSADIVVDQLRLGDFGVAACEAMAAGCVVVGHVSEFVREHVLTATGLSLPIVEATIHDLETIIRGLVDRPESVQKISQQGVKFAHDIHDGQFSARVLQPFLT